MKDFPEEVMSKLDREGFWNEEEEGGQYKGSRRE